jgi:hypothetical protein
MQILDLIEKIVYHSFSFLNHFQHQSLKKGLPPMKLAVRTLAICLVVAGAAAASLSPATSHALTSRQAVNSALPVPLCGPWEPCPPGPNGNLR